jgi:transmembrane sensor
VDIKSGVSPLPLRLLAGEIQIDSLRTSQQGVQVQTPHGQALLQSAQCAIRLFAGYTSVSVQVGSAEVSCAGQRVVVLAGQQLSYSTMGLGPIQPASASSRSWVDGLFVAEGVPLGQLITELGRYRHGVLGCDPQVANLRVVGAFSVRDTDRALASLVDILPVRVNRLMPWWVTLEARV